MTSMATRRESLIRSGFVGVYEAMYLENECDCCSDWQFLLVLADLNAGELRKMKGVQSMGSATFQPSPEHGPERECPAAAVFRQD